MLILSHVRNNTPFYRQRCNERKKFCNSFIILSIAAGGIMLILYYGSSIWQKVGGDPADLPPFFQDNWDDNIGNGTSVGTFSRWHNRGNGLQLTLVNGRLQFYISQHLIKS